MSDILPFALSIANRILNAVSSKDDTFERETNKISSSRTFSRRKVLVTCNGNDTMTVTPLSDITDQIRDLHKLRKDGIITPAEFEAAKKKLLDRI